MSTLPSFVRIMEVSPRDGLQIERTLVPAAGKVQLIDRLVDAGFREIEVTSFVSPKAVPQLADCEEVLAALTHHEGVRYRALWLNRRGLVRAIDNGRVDVDGMVVLTASETFLQRNQKRGIEDVFVDMPDWITEYQSHSIPVETIMLMAAFGCNFEGDIPGSAVTELIARATRILEEHGERPTRIVLADTMGWANPEQVRRLVGSLMDRWPTCKIKLHLHDTRGLAIANAIAAMESGVVDFDASVGGLGGCPFAGHSGAAGNMCTEDFVHACEEMGVATGIDLEKLLVASKLAEELVGHELPGKVMKGGTLHQRREARSSAFAGRI